MDTGACTRTAAFVKSLFVPLRNLLSFEATHSSMAGQIRKTLAPVHGTNGAVTPAGSSRP
ncbi:hypothetical protein BOSEA31B_13514 [Hyphomicrobiales bacterium]|nr:hypothetical protein BOSEA31B_13514 [Hyphomicrobiales bacterium]CAH1699285.1 hypothetical protein BOSEA1005_12338 [Hyphomicrobiales bacterium]CAI0343072.1 hypothetical protein BO1005MUT1_210137 [Hyphomicrobiales bacterium]